MVDLMKPKLVVETVVHGGVDEVGLLQERSPARRLAGSKYRHCATFGVEMKISVLLVKCRWVLILTAPYRQSRKMTKR